MCLPFSPFPARVVPSGWSDLSCTFVKDLQLYCRNEPKRWNCDTIRPCCYVCSGSTRPVCGCSSLSVISVSIFYTVYLNFLLGTHPLPFVQLIFDNSTRVSRRAGKRTLEKIFPLTAHNTRLGHGSSLGRVAPSPRYHHHFSSIITLTSTPGDPHPHRIPS